MLATNEVQSVPNVVNEQSPPLMALCSPSIANTDNLSFSPIHLAPYSGGTTSTRPHSRAQSQATNSFGYDERGCSPPDNNIESRSYTSPLDIHTIDDEGLLAQGQLGALRDDTKVVGNDELVTGEVEIMGEGTGFTMALLSPLTEQWSASTTAHAFDPTLNLCQGPTISLPCSSISPISCPLTCLPCKETNLPMNCDWWLPLLS